MKKLLFFICLLVLTACARPPVENAPTAENSWQKMLAVSAENANKPNRVQFSLRFGTEGNTRRVTALLWSNDNDTVRLDVSAGVGVTMAKILDEPGNFLLVVPPENKAYEHAGKQRPLLRIGAPLPFDLSQLAHILAGQYSQAFGTSPEKIVSGSSDKFELDQEPGGVLQLDANGLPVSWKTANWNLQFVYKNENSLPSGLRLTGRDGKMAVLLVKSRDLPEKAFDREQMSLPLPGQTQKLPLSEYKT